MSKDDLERLKDNSDEFADQLMNEINNFDFSQMTNAGIEQYLRYQEPYLKN
jgi:hypothetical protein